MTIFFAVLSVVFWAGSIFLLRRFAWLPTKGWLEERGFEFSFRHLVILALAVAAAVGLVSLGASLFVAIIMTLIVFFVFLMRNVGKAREGHQRGGMIVDAIQLQNLAKMEDPKATIRIGGTNIPGRYECRHFLLSGSTGSGKSQAFYQLVEAARRRGDAGVVADVNAEMLSRFFDPTRGDVLLSPLDTRSANWSPLAEIAGPWDGDRVAKSLIPDGDGGAAEWNHYAQVLLSACLAKVWRDGGKNFDLVHLLLMASNEDLASALSGTQAAQLFAPGAERMLSSIRAITATYCQPLSYLSPTVGRDGFSITKFIQAEAKQRHGAWIFMPVRDDFFKSFRSLIAGQIDVAISALLSSPDDEARRVWFCIDEFATWGKISSIGDLLTKARKKGGVGVLGLQSISQIREAYGREGAQTLLSCLGNWLSLRSGDAETADYMSRAIGDEQIRRLNESLNADGQKSTSEQIAIQRVILPAELQSLPDLEGILNIAGPLPAGWVRIPVSGIQRRHPGFDMVQT